MELKFKFKNNKNLLPYIAGFHWLASHINSTGVPNERGLVQSFMHLTRIALTFLTCPAVAPSLQP